VASRKQRVAAELEARCIPFLRALNRIAQRSGGPVGDPAPVLDGLVTAFGRLLDGLHEACAPAGPPADFAALPEDRKLRLLFARYRLSCSFHDEVLSIVAARNRARTTSQSALRPLALRWSRPLLGSGTSETQGRALYIEWRRSIRYVRAGEPLILAGWELRAIACTLRAAGDELLGLGRRKLGGARGSPDALPGAVRLARSPERRDQGANCSLRTRSSRLFSGSKSRVRPMVRSSWTSTRATSRTSL
jgi:hypothetical protein